MIMIIFTFLLVCILVYVVSSVFICFNNHFVSQELSKKIVKYKPNRNALVKHINYKGHNDIELILCDHKFSHQIKCTLDDLEF